MGIKTNRDHNIRNEKKKKNTNAITTENQMSENCVHKCEV
jgi:hypothetical protein